MGKPKTLAALAAAALLLGGLALRLSRRADRLDSVSPLSGLAPGEVFKIEVERQGEAPLALEEKAGVWRMSAPVADLADAGAVSDLLAVLSSLSIGTEVSAQAADYDGYGLSESSATRVKVYTRDKAVAALDGWFGRPALGEQTVYFRRSREKPVWLAEGVDQAVLLRPADAYRERAFFPERLGALRSLMVASGSLVLQARKGTPQWETAAALRAADFAAPLPDSETGLSAPVLILQGAGAARSARWLIGKPRPEKGGKKPVYRYARCDERPGVLALVASYDADALLKSLKR